MRRRSRRRASPKAWPRNWAKTLNIRRARALRQPRVAAMWACRFRRRSFALDDALRAELMGSVTASQNVSVRANMAHENVLAATLAASGGFVAVSVPGRWARARRSAQRHFRRGQRDKRGHGLCDHGHSLQKPLGGGGLWRRRGERPTRRFRSLSAASPAIRSWARRQRRGRERGSGRQCRNFDARGASRRQRWRCGRGRGRGHCHRSSESFYLYCADPQGVSASVASARCELRAMCACATPLRPSPNR